jgi:hypothetical protein
MLLQIMMILMGRCQSVNFEFQSNKLVNQRTGIPMMPMYPNNSQISHRIVLGFVQPSWLA